MKKTPSPFPDLLRSQHGALVTRRIGRVQHMARPGLGRRRREALKGGKLSGEGAPSPSSLGTTAQPEIERLWMF